MLRQATRAKRVADVPCAPLGDLMLAATGRATADFLSLDVEGAEDIVLESTPPSNFKVIMVEAGGRESDRRVSQLMLAAGMRRLQATLPLGHFDETARNDVWLSPAVPAGRDDELLDMRIPRNRRTC